MLICHISDWHGKTKPLPEADIYVVTGDMMPDFYDVRFRAPGGKEGIWVPELKQPWPEGAQWMGRIMDPDTCRVKQLEWQQQNPARILMNIGEDKSVLVVRGNHDWCDLAGWFGGDVWEVTEDATRTTKLLGLTFGGFRGVPPINGEWNDETSEPDIFTRAEAIPDDVDVLITHCPPYRILDTGHWGDDWGSESVRRYVEARWMNRQLREPPLRLHMFGHVHESSGQKRLVDTLFSNAACTVQMVEL